MKQYSLLSIGDSYTIGERVAEPDRFPNQAIKLLSDKGLSFAPAKIIAQTGWTTDELIAAIDAADVKQTFDYVTLLIGVNNQYRRYDSEKYRVEFGELLHTAIRYAGGDKRRVSVLSIPDWGVTPFVANDAHKRTGAEIGQEVDAFNAINKQVCRLAHVHYIDITPISRRAATDASLTAPDGLHPSASMYALWAELVADEMYRAITKHQKQ
jgi:lysophospholipase L1-like esterase